MNILALWMYELESVLMLNNWFVAFWHLRISFLLFSIQNFPYRYLQSFEGFQLTFSIVQHVLNAPNFQFCLTYWCNVLILNLINYSNALNRSISFSIENDTLPHRIASHRYHSIPQLNSTQTYSTQCETVT